MIADADMDGSGKVDFGQFLPMNASSMGESDSGEEILKASRPFDDDETGKISSDNLERAAEEPGENAAAPSPQRSNEAAVLRGASRGAGGGRQGRRRRGGRGGVPPRDGEDLAVLRAPI